jgi:hypothetical protein
MLQTAKEIRPVRESASAFFMADMSGSLPMARATRQKRELIFSRPEQRAIVREALKILPNFFRFIAAWVSASASATGRSGT